MHVVSEAPGIVFKKNRKCVKKLSKFIGMWGIDNGLIVLTSKNYKIPKNVWYFKTRVNSVVNIHQK